MTTEIPDSEKTAKMLLLELYFSEDIDDLIAIEQGTVRKVGERLNVHYTLVSRWRKRFDIKPTR